MENTTVQIIKKNALAIAFGIVCALLGLFIVANYNMRQEQVQINLKNEGYRIGVQQTRLMIANEVANSGQVSLPYTDPDGSQYMLVLRVFDIKEVATTEKEEKQNEEVATSTEANK